MFKPLTIYDLSKRGGYRFDILSNKIINEIPFNLVNGENKILKFDRDEYLDLFLNKKIITCKHMFHPINKFPFFTDIQTQYSISDLTKDQSFGGKGTGSGTVVEDYNLNLLNLKLYELINKHGGYIDVLIKNKKYKYVHKAISQSGTPKSDFNIINTSNEPVIFISHKKAGIHGPSPDDFIRWSGYTRYNNDLEVLYFNDRLNDFIYLNSLDGVPNQTRFIYKLKNINLIHKLIYGSEYGNENHGPDNINIILQGNINLHNIYKNIYKLTAEHSYIPPSIPKNMYYPYLTAGYRADRNMFNIKNNEAIVMTKSTAHKSSNVYELKKDKFIKIK